jgi:hypothetical protein
LTYREQQKFFIAELNRHATDGSYPATFIHPSNDYRSDARVSLGLFLLPPLDFIADLQWSVQSQLLKTDPHQYATPSRAMHFTFKNIQTVADPPTFSPQQAESLVPQLQSIIARYPAFDLECEGLLVTPSSIGVVGFYPENIGKMVLEIDEMLTQFGLPDNKKYVSSSVTFTNITLIRYTKAANLDLLRKAAELQDFRRKLSVSSLQLVSADLSFTPEKTRIWAHLPFSG